MNTPATTTIAQLRQADWDKLHDDVSLRIGLLEKAVNNLDPNPLNDKIAQELLMPALRLLADFCIRIEVKIDPEDSSRYAMNVFAPESDRESLPPHGVVPLNSESP